MAYRLTKRARLDVLDIWRHIAEDNEAGADRFVDLITHYIRLLGENPHAGRRRDDLRAGYRSFPVGEYLYRIMQPGIRILHVVHDRRNIVAMLRH